MSYFPRTVLQFNVFVGADEVQTRLRANNVFTVARRNLEGQEMLYESLKLVNDIWVLAEIKMQPGASSIMVYQKPYIQCKLH